MQSQIRLLATSALLASGFFFIQLSDAQEALSARAVTEDENGTDEKENAVTAPLAIATLRRA